MSGSSEIAAPPERHRAVVAEARDVIRAHNVIAYVCPEYDVLYSSWTGQHYVSAKVRVGDGHMLTSMVEHRPTPQQAMIAFAEALEAVRHPKYLVTDAGSERRNHWRFDSTIGHIIRLAS